MHDSGAVGKMIAQPLQFEQQPSPMPGGLGNFHLRHGFHGLAIGQRVRNGVVSRHPLRKLPTICKGFFLEQLFDAPMGEA